MDLRFLTVSLSDTEKQAKVLWSWSVSAATINPFPFNWRSFSGTAPLKVCTPGLKGQPPLTILQPSIWSPLNWTAPLGLTCANVMGKDVAVLAIKKINMTL